MAKTTSQIETHHVRSSLGRHPEPKVEAHTHVPDGKGKDGDTDNDVEEVDETDPLSVPERVADLSEHGLEDSEQDERNAELLVSLVEVRHAECPDDAET